MKRCKWIWILTLIILVGCQDGAVPATPAPIETTAGPPTAAPTLTSALEPTQPATLTASPTIPPTEEPTQVSQPSQAADLSGTPLPPLTAGKELTVTAVEMINPTSGWAIGTQAGGPDYILFTSDSGETWEDRSPPVRKSGNLSELHAQGYFLDSQSAWVVYAYHGPPPVKNKVIWKTTDSGRNWVMSQPLPLTGDELYFQPESPAFIDQNTGWLLAHVDAGGGRDFVELFHTRDGGTTWKRLDDPYRGDLSGSENTDLGFGSQDWGWVTKDNPQLIPGGAFLAQTVDGGDNWELVFLPPPEDLDWDEVLFKCKTFQPTFTSPQTGLVLVECQIPVDSDGLETHSYIYSTSDRGENWQYTRLPSPVSDLEFVNLQVGYAAGLNIYSTTNGGLDWVKIKTVTWHGRLSFVSPDLGWAVARKGEDIALVQTVNGGSTWQIITPLAAP